VSAWARTLWLLTLVSSSPNPAHRSPNRSLCAITCSFASLRRFWRNSPAQSSATHQQRAPKYPFWQPFASSNQQSGNPGYLGELRGPFSWYSQRGSCGDSRTSQLLRHRYVQHSSSSWMSKRSGSLPCGPVSGTWGLRKSMRNLVRKEPAKNGIDRKTAESIGRLYRRKIRFLEDPASPEMRQKLRSQSSRS